MERKDKNECFHCLCAKAFSFDVRICAIKCTLSEGFCTALPLCFHPEPRIFVFISWQGGGPLSSLAGTPFLYVRGPSVQLDLPSGLLPDLWRLRFEVRCLLPSLANVFEAGAVLQSYGLERAEWGSGLVQMVAERLKGSESARGVCAPAAKISVEQVLTGQLCCVHRLFCKRRVSRYCPPKDGQGRQRGSVCGAAAGVAAPHGRRGAGAALRRAGAAVTVGAGGAVPGADPPAPRGCPRGSAEGQPLLPGTPRAVCGLGDVVMW